MGGENLSALIAEVAATRQLLERGDGATSQRFSALETSLNDLFRKFGRIGGGIGDDDYDLSRKSAIGYCRERRALTVPRLEGNVTADYSPHPDELSEATLATKAMRKLIRTADIGKLDHTERKSLSSFQFGSNQFLLPPEMSNQVLSCLVDQSDLTGLMNLVNLSAGSIRFLVDNVQLEAEWGACGCGGGSTETDFSGLGEVDLRVEPLRFVACATNDMLSDAAFNVENWLLNKVSLAFRQALNRAVISGTGINMPIGITNPSAGIPICDTAAPTPAGTFTWQDLIMLRTQVPAQWWQNGVYLMNQNTFGLTLSMSDANGRPIMLPSLSGAPGMSLLGSRVVIASQMPDPLPGATPVLFGDLRSLYTVAIRSAPTLKVDDATSFCSVFRIEQRVGGMVSCPNAGRLLRIR